MNYTLQIESTMTINEITKIATERANRHEIEEANLYGGLGKTYSYSRIKNAEISSFIAGAELIDSLNKPTWIGIKEDLPCNHKELINPEDETETVQVLVNMGGTIGITKMVKNNHTGEWLWATRVTVYYWMPIPKLPEMPKSVG